MPRSFVAGKQWFYLPYQGVLREQDESLIELRACPTCGSSLARKTTKAEQERSLRAMAAVLSSSLASPLEDGCTEPTIHRTLG